MQKIVVTPVKNESWILSLTLACHSLWADKIIVADQKSDDNTREICLQFPKVQLIKNDSTQFNEAERRQILLNEVRKNNKNALIFALDADEILSAEALDNSFWQELSKKIHPGMSISMQWMQLWDGFETYNNSKTWRDKKVFAYYDDGVSNFGKGLMHLPRVPDSYLDNFIDIETPKVLHFQFVNLNRSQAKQRYYQVLDKVIGRVKNDFKNNFIYGVTKQKPKLLPIPKKWLAGYLERGINFSYDKKENTYWNKEIIKYFLKHTSKEFKWLDIWDIDWKKETERLNLLNTGQGPFADPRGITIKIYHRLQKTELINTSLRNLMMYFFNTIKQGK